MLNNPFRYLRRKWTNHRHVDELHCIRYSLLVPALAAAYVVARGALSLHALDVHMYFTKLTQDMGVLEQTRKLSCMAYPFRLLR